eukprot:CAMPEP_0182430696 /NCGR_PEP_ID=MMETSP1167-20130531/42659_1 /TAXON_ID=2988 /ORGANISM="Mallomonas Sp, Strain CCMP3275" /LENGTH=502 /DNA_ID=CAMNT_0024616087 /DNA_START=97 /DNA_END=1605 /DNA_ORIENTATION=+
MISTSFPRIFSVQSHIVHGYVGNKAATFPLQCLGFNVDAINTVHLSNHPSYSGGFKGKGLTGDEFSALVNGLQSNNLLNFDMIMSGYISNEDVLSKLPDVIRLVKSVNPKAIYVCDPVLGDLDEFYVPKKLLEVYTKEVIPVSDVITPNIFEAENITGITIRTTTSALSACEHFHSMGVKVCLLTGLSLSGPTGPLSMVLSSKDMGLAYRIDVPRINCHFSGCGDLCAALFSGWFALDPTDLGRVLDKTATTMSYVLTDTKHRQSKELSIVENIDTFRNPPQPAVPAYVVHGPVVGVIFDMDGTLTEAGAIDFNAIFSRIGLQRDDGDVLSQIAKLPLEKQAAAHEIVLEEEMKGCERMLIREDTISVLTTLKNKRIRTAVATRNCKPAYDKFEMRLLSSISTIVGSSTTSEIFSMVLTRDTLLGVNKPDPRVANHILDDWTVTRPETVWFVGDHADDMTCGKRAGCRTCLIVAPDRFTTECSDADVVVHSLTEFLRIIGLA